MQRKLIIATTLALVVGGLAVTFGTRKQPLVTVAYESVSERDAGQVWFECHTTITNLTRFRAYELQKADGRWQAVTNSETQNIYIQEASTFGLLRNVPQGDRHWRMVLEYQPNQEKTALWRVRHRLWVFTLQKQWRKLADWLKPMNPEILYGPEMLGNKPVEKQ